MLPNRDPTVGTGSDTDLFTELASCWECSALAAERQECYCQVESWVIQEGAHLGGKGGSSL